MLEIFLLVVGLVAGFVLGVLFGRKNPKGVEAAVAQAKAEWEQATKKGK